ncbi:T9SS type B sorting domain-containing protein [Flavobacterium sp. SM2513]|uniref:T9SS type B sorting domain-containing protein n=1 Tax=Flavobacterium sp. SM2513 TaxID=3424766 RepID=UPI003D7F24EB
MKGYLIVLSLFFALLANAQGEATNWYFGEYAGLKFMPDGSVIPLSDGQIVTNEGCSSISDSSGNLLLYTDGKTVWDRNHVIMPNGVNLFGDPSSTSSGIIIPKPNDPNIYYIFTVDEPHQENAAAYPNGFTGEYQSQPGQTVPTDDDGFNNGFNYSIVDLSVIGANGSIGDVISKNNHLITYDTSPSSLEIRFKCSEKITAVRDPSTNSFWIITHFIDKFYAFKVDATGLNTDPVVTTIGANIGIVGYRRNAIGYLKASPDGQKLAVAHNQNGNLPGEATLGTGTIELFDFNVASGIVSNTQTVLPNIQPYGLEFSSSSEKLYASYRVNANPNIELAQFDLLSNNITASKTILYDSTPSLFGLQLAPNNKIYISTSTSVLGVINDPDENGLLCNYTHQGLQLAVFTTSRLGLPPFITSFFFTPAIQLENACVGQNTAFQFNTSQEITSATWDFGDGSSSSDLSPTHVYATAGNYTVSVTVVGANGSGVNTREITIHAYPILNAAVVNLKQCDDNNDGFSAFNLNEIKSLLVNDATNLTFSFFETLLEAENNTDAFTNSTNYTNQNINSEAIFVRVENTNGCYATAQINLQVSTTTIPASFQKVFAACDDLASGSLTDGVTTFDFSSVTSEIQAQYPPGQAVDITYYRNLADALAELNAITDISNYSNIGYPNTQNIYVRVDSEVNNDCLGLGHHITLNVEKIPIVQPQTVKECDDNEDGILNFDTSNVEANLLNGLANVSVIYTDENGVLLPSPLPNPFTTSSQTVSVIVKNNFGKQCEYSSTLTFVVDDLPEAFAIPTNLTSICDDEMDPQLQNGEVPFDTTAFESAILAGQTGLNVSYFDANNVALPSPLPNPFTSSTQTLRAEFTNPLNAICTATVYIPLVVLATPSVLLTGTELICTDDLRATRVIDAGLVHPSTQNDFTYAWFLNNILVPNETNYVLTVDEGGIYTVEVTNQNGCTSTRTIVVTASNAAIIENITITDLSADNTIEITASGLGDYVYNLNDGYYQESPVFSGLQSGIYTIGIQDVKGCSSVFETVYVIGAPKYFTPNADGYNDYWNVSFLDPNLELKVTVFDRFGKLLKQFNARDQGWDGTYNGQELPSTDYWFTIEFQSGRMFRGHFSLRR